jgi:hypothetical protein
MPSTRASTVSLCLLLRPSSSGVGSVCSNCAQFVFMTLAGLLGLRMCTNAVRLYYFCIDWNLISHKEWADLAALHFCKQNFITRKMQILKALTTTSYSKQDRIKDCVDNVNEDETETTHETSSIERDDATLKQYAHEICKSRGNCSASSSTTVRQKRRLPSSTTSCPICLGEFKEKEQICCSKDVAICAHVFHLTCLQAWLLKHASCPICRFEMAPHTPIMSPDLEARSQPTPSQ